MNTYTYSTANAACKVKWLEVNANYDTKTTGILVVLYAMNTGGAVKRFGWNSTVTVQAGSLSKVYLTNNEWVSLPNDSQYHKIGAVIIPNVSHSSRSLSLKISGNIGEINIDNTKTIQLSTVDKNDIKTVVPLGNSSLTYYHYPATIKVESGNIYLDESKNIEIKKTYTTNAVKLRYLFGSDDEEKDDFKDKNGDKITADYTFPFGEFEGKSKDVTLALSADQSSLVKNKQSDSVVLIGYTYFVGNVIGFPTCTMFKYILPYEQNTERRNVF